MNQPQDFYHSQLKKYNSSLEKVKGRLAVFSLLRLLVFLTMIFLAYWYWGDSIYVAAIILVGIMLFVFLVSRHSDLKDDRDKYQELISINKIELEVLDRNFSHLSTGEEFEDPEHPFSQDVDLFGSSSFFQYLNRSSLIEGKELLARLLLSNNIENIADRQKAVKELSEKADWRQNFAALASLTTSKTRTPTIIEWLDSYQPFVPRVMKWLPYLFSTISGIVIISYFFDYIGGIELAIWFFAGLLTTGIYVKKINLLSQSVDKVQDTFHQYFQLLLHIERIEFSSDLLRNKRDKIVSGREPASVVLQRFSKAIDALDQRNNMIFGLLGNGFLLWDLRQSLKIEDWIRKYSENVEAYFEVIEFLDAFNSLGNFAFNHPDYVFPNLVSSNHVIQAEDLAHPLLDPEKRISNDFTIENENFFIITGANMAGKSTFLRTVSLQIMMSNCGLPVCAASCSYRPIKLITSMRTTDSLTDDESYFFSELKRLKYIVEEIGKDKYFIILDEILKGTNSKDKAIGSRKFIEKLVRSDATGIIATHDLSLCEVTHQLPQVHNYYFDAEIFRDELSFDYRFKPGICRNMNASFLLKKMGIVE